MSEATATTAPSRAPAPSPAQEAAHRSPSRLWVVLGTLGAIFLGVILLVAVWGKAIAPTAFIGEIESRGLGVLIGSTAVSYLALALEAGLGLLLLLGVRRLWVLVPTALLVAFFLALTGQDYVRSLAGLETHSASCGCFGNLVARSPGQAFWQDLGLMVPALVLAFFGRPKKGTARTVPPVRTTLAVVAAVAAVVLAWKAPSLPLDNLATRLKPGVEVADLCVGEGTEKVCLDTVAPSLDPSKGGDHLVILADLDDAFGESVETINAYADRRMMAEDDGDQADLPDLTVITSAGPDERQAFFWQWAPAFEPAQAPEALLEPLYRTLPRSFAVSNGEVTETWSGLPPFERWTAGSTEETRSTTP